MYTEKIGAAFNLVFWLVSGHFLDKFQMQDEQLNGISIPRALWSSGVQVVKEKFHQKS